MRAAIPQGCDSLPAQTLRTFLQSVERCGHDAAPLLKSLDLEPGTLASVPARAPWHELVSVVHRFVQDAGQVELERVGRDMALTLPILRVLGSLLMPPRAFYRVLLQCFARPCFWAIRSEETGTRMTIHVDLKRTVEGSAPLLSAMGHLLSATPKLLNLPEVEVDIRVSSPHSARYAFELPRGRSLHLRPNEGQLATIVHHLRDGHRHEQHDVIPTIAALEAHYGLTRAEGRVVRRLVAGRSLVDIAQELGVGTETVRTHAKRAMQKTDTHRQAELVALVLRMGSRSREH